MADNIALDGEKAYVDLDLTGDDQAILRTRPFPVEVCECFERGVIVWALSERFLHWTFYEAVGECETAWEG